MLNQFYAHGKLLLTGEYFVLDGAEALALPSRYGQHMQVQSVPGPYEVHWQAKDIKGENWLECRLSGVDFSILETTDEDAARRLQSVLVACKSLQADFLHHRNRYEVITRLEFPREWGLGSSSTLISLVARWAEVNAWTLLEATFGGSGYDLACAEATGSILYTCKNGIPATKPAPLHPFLYKEMFFIYLGQKQNSREGIRLYRSKGKPADHLLGQINRETASFLAAADRHQLIDCMQRHESIVGDYLGLTPLKESLFPDFEGGVKSLGAWGGDFFAAVAKEGDEKYLRDFFEGKGFHTIFPFEKMALEGR